MTFGGILTAMVTPFDERGRVDEDAFVAMVHHLLENGSDGLVVAGTTGEGATLSPTTRRCASGSLPWPRPAARP